MSEKAVRLAEKFNNRPYRGYRNANLNITQDLVDLGPCVAVAYASRKEGAHKHYEHKFRSARLLSTDDGKTLIITGANIRVTDWIRG